MKKTDLEKSMDKAIEVKLRAVDLLVEELIAPLEKLGNPEELIGKPYASWDAQDFMLLSQIYGQSDVNNPLADLVFKKEYAKVKQMEEEENA